MGDGDVVIRNGRPQTIEISLVNSANFRIMAAHTSGDSISHNQLSWNLDTTLNKITFTDKANLAEEGVEIFITITNLSHAREFVCDPRVSNEN